MNFICKLFIVLGFVAILSHMPAVLSFLRRMATTALESGGNGSNLLYSMAFVTVPDEDVAKKISHGLVENKLAACVNIIPKITSVYEWEGKINEDSELLLMIKTRTSVLERLVDFVKKNHPYSVCEVISTSIEKGNPDYLDWIGKATQT